MVMTKRLHFAALTHTILTQWKELAAFGTVGQYGWNHICRAATLRRSHADFSKRVPTT